jgi:RHS repeat-associated protein
MTSQSRLVVEGNIFDDTLGNIQPLAIISEKYDGTFNQSQLLDPSTATLNLQTTGTTQQYLCGNKCVKKGVLKLHLHSGGSEKTIVNTNSSWNYAITVTITANNNGYTCSSTFPVSNPTLALNQSKPETVYYLEVPADCLPGYSTTCSNNNANGITSISINKVSSTYFPTNLNSIIEVDLRLDATFTLIYEQEIFNTNLALGFQHSGKICETNTNTNTLYKNSGSTIDLFWAPYVLINTPCSDIVSSYQIQLLRLYNTDANPTIDEYSIETTVDWNKALTFETDKERLSINAINERQISITLSEGRGYYTWRVRPIFNIYPGGVNNPQNFGLWSNSPTQGTNLVITDNCAPNTEWDIKSIFFNEGFDNNTNWSYSRGFAEADKDGIKIGEGIAFANYLMEPVQSQVRNMTDNSTIISHTVYDLSGRPLVTTLPTPIDDRNYLGYYSNFLGTTPPTSFTFDGGSQYSASQTLGSSQPSSYYSAAGTSQIPDADEIPYGKFNVNREGKVSVIGGIGAQKRIDAGNNNTKISYGGVSELELTSVFGKEAPRVNAVTKSIIKDANNVSSVVYSDMSGNTLATCLIAGTDEVNAASQNGGVIASDDAQSTLLNPYYEKINSLQIEDIITAKDNTTTSTPGTTISSKKIVLNKQQYVEIIYDPINEVPKISVLQGETASCTESFCKTCDYNIIINVKNALDGSIVHTVGNINPNALSSITNFEKSLCNTSPQFNGTSFIINLNPGEYIIERIVTAMNNRLQSGTEISIQEMYVNEALQGVRPLEEILLEFFPPPLEIPLTDYEQYYNLYRLQYYAYRQNYINDADKKVSINTDPRACRFIDLPEVSCYTPCDEANNTLKGEKFFQYLSDKLSEVKIDPTQPPLNNTMVPNTDDINDNKRLFFTKDGGQRVQNGFELKTLITNMLSSSCYDCSTLYPLWQRVVDRYITTLKANIKDERSGNPSISRISTDGKFYAAYYKDITASPNKTIYIDILDEFINLAKRRCITNDNTTIYISQFFTVSPNLQYSHIDAYKKIYVKDYNDVVKCIAAFQSNTNINTNWTGIVPTSTIFVPSGQLSSFYESYDAFYACISNQYLLTDENFVTKAKELLQIEDVNCNFVNDPAPFDCRKAVVASLNEECKILCSEREDEFRELYIQMMVNQGNTIIPDEEIDCAVALLIDDCKKGCALAIDPNNGSIDPLTTTKYEESTTGKVSLQYTGQQGNPVCLVGYRSLGQSYEYNAPLAKILVEYLTNEYQRISATLPDCLHSPPIVENFAVKACNFLASLGQPCPPCISTSTVLQNVLVYPCSPAYFAYNRDDLPDDGRYGEQQCPLCEISFYHEDICTNPPYIAQLNAWLDKTWGIQLNGNTIDRFKNFNTLEKGFVNEGNSYNHNDPVYDFGFLTPKDYDIYQDPMRFDYYYKHTNDFVTYIKDDIIGTSIPSLSIEKYSTFPTKDSSNALTGQSGFNVNSACGNIFNSSGIADIPLGNADFDFYPFGSYTSLQSNYGWYPQVMKYPLVVNNLYYTPLGTYYDDYQEATLGVYRKQGTTPSPWKTFGSIRFFPPFPRYAQPPYFMCGIYPVFSRYGDGSPYFNGIYIYLNYGQDNPYYPEIGPGLEVADGTHLLSDRKIVFSFDNHLSFINNIYNNPFTTTIGNFSTNPNGYLQFHDLLRNVTRVFSSTRFGRLIRTDINCDLSFCEVKYQCKRFCVKYDITPPTIPVVDPQLVEKIVVDNCYTLAVKNAKAEIARRYYALIDKMEQEVRSAYKEKCSAKNFVNDKLTIKYADNYYHYTLYYYDVTGKLIKTVSPKGVDMNPTYTRASTPQHTFVSTFEYNSYGQVIKETVPDGGSTVYAYNTRGQLRAVQTAKQAADERISIINYDALQRIKETKEIARFAALLPDSYINDVGTIADNAPVRDKTTFTYTSLPTTLPAPYGTITQNNTRNKISYVEFDNGDLSGNDIATSYYSYDPHGNIEWVLQQNPGLQGIKIDYSYELISGNMKRVSYRKGYEDQLFHQYIYDRDNRLQTVQTSLDTVIWDNDITYKYYPHGPIQRVEIGEDKIQGIDYAYTIHGWLKAMNHPNSQYDPGGDGNSTIDRTEFAKDAFSTILHYYANDYNGYGNNYTNMAITPLHNLYDGNIAGITYKNAHLNTNNDYHTEDIVGDRYRYDKLGRLREDIFYINSGGSFSRSSGAKTNMYDSRYIYDQNSNLKHLSRRSLYQDGSNPVQSKQIDSLTYTYKSASSNQLDHVQDVFPTATPGVNDIANQILDRYEYDAQGNLIEDRENGVLYEWNSHGKIRKVYKPNEFTIVFDYDAQGNKVRKQVFTGTTASSTTYYVYDAMGTLMAVYKKDATTNNVVSLSEAPINAPGRIGMWRFGATDKPHDNTPIANNVRVYDRSINKKLYELTDQTGNVRAVVGDTKRWVGNETVPSVPMSANYYPYGMAQAGRVASAGADYRYGYNGMEEEDRGDAVSSEIASTGAKAKPGEANLLNTEFRLYDPRLGQWLTRDPVFQPWESPYSAMGGNPILFSDPLGLNETNSKGTWSTGDDGIPIFTPNPGFEVVVTANRTPESVIANDNSFYDFLNKNRVSIPSVNNSTISSPSPPSFYQRIIREWNDFNNNFAISTMPMPYGGGAAVQFGSRILYSSLDALQVTTSNLFHKLHLQNRPATHLDGSYANDNEVQAGFFSLYMDLFPIGGLTRLAKSGKGVVKAVDNVAEAVVDDVAEGVGKGVYIPETPLMQHKVDDIDIPLPDPRAGNSPHTVLGGRIGENGVLYRQSATFTESSWPLANGKKVPWSRVDWSTHNRPAVHPYPHQHIFLFDFLQKRWTASEPVKY